MNSEINIGISNIPGSKLNPVGFRSVTSSKDYNENQENIINDILNLYNKANSISEKIADMGQLSNCQNTITNTRIEHLKAKIDNLIGTLSGNIKSLYIYPADVKTERVSPAKIDNSTCITMTPAKSISKLRVENSEDIILLPPSLIVELNDITGSGIKSVTGNDVYKAFDGKCENIWYRKIVTDNSISVVETTMTITLPEDVVTTYNINEIRLSPFPCNGLNIVNIKYRMSNGAWKVIPGFSDHSEYVLNKGIENSPNILFNFKDIVANQIQITFQQQNHVMENGNKVFYIGCSDIDVRSNKYDDSSNFFNFNINIPSNISNPVINNVEAIYNNHSQLAPNSVQYEFYYTGDDKLLHKVRESMPFVSPSNNLTVKCKMINNDCTANISKFKISYSK